MSGLFTPGTPRIAVLDGSGNKTKTLYLPQPDAGMPTVEWVAKGIVQELYDGSEAWRQLGWLPELVLRWSVYDDRPDEGFTIGSLNGNRPAVTDFLTLLSSAPGLLKVSPGPLAGGFVAGSWKVDPIGVLAFGFTKGLQVTFRGATVQSSMLLGTF